MNINIKKLEFQNEMRHWSVSKRISSIESERSVGVPLPTSLEYQSGITLNSNSLDINTNLISLRIPNESSLIQLGTFLDEKELPPNTSGGKMNNFLQTSPVLLRWVLQLIVQLYGNHCTSYGRLIPSTMIKYRG